MVRKKVITVICIVITAVSVIGCQSSGNNTSTVGSSDTSQAASSETGESASGWEEDGSIVGQVTAVEGNEITLALGTMEGREARHRAEKCRMERCRMEKCRMERCRRR